MSDLFSVASGLGLCSLFRIVIPGLAWALLLLPLVNPLVPQMLRIDEIVDLATILLPETLVLGLLASLFTGTIYRLFEGRLMWPLWLHTALTRRLNSRVRKRLAESEKLDHASVQYKELWYWLRMFPLDGEGDPVARRPTILGNVLEGYEEYPLRRYGMDSVFYWYRLVPKLPESFIDQIEQLWAEADCLMHISFAGLVMGLVYALLAIAKWILPSVISRWTIVPAPTLATLSLIPTSGTPVGWALGCLIVGYAAYCVSLPLHRRNGEYFKAAFDVYRGSIMEAIQVSPEEKEAWRKAWSYLQYMYVQCPSCGEYYFAEAEQCPHCGRRRRSQDQPDIVEKREAPHWVHSLVSSLFRLLSCRE